MMNDLLDPLFDAGIFGYYFEKATRLEAVGKYKEAFEAFEEARKIDPNNRNVLFKRSALLTSLGKYEQAIESYNSLLKHYSNDHEAFNGKAVCLEFLKYYDEALACFDRAIEICRQKINHPEEMIQDEDDFSDFQLDTNIEITNFYTQKACFALKQSENVYNKNRNSLIALVNTENNINKVPPSLKYDVYISFSWNQKAEAHNLFNLLTSFGFNCCIDCNEHVNGEEYYEQLGYMIVESKMIVLCMSRDYLQSTNCNRQFMFMRNHEKTIIPIIFTRNDEIEKQFGVWPLTHNIISYFNNSNFVFGIYECLLDLPNNTKNTELLNNFLLTLKNYLCRQTTN